MTLRDQALAAFAQVCGGEARAEAKADPVEVYAGNIEYALTNGWRVVVFNDCGEWDYVDSIVAPDGRVYYDDAQPDADRQRLVDHLVPCGKNGAREGCPHWGWYSYLYPGPPPEWVSPAVKAYWEKSYVKRTRAVSQDDK